MPGTGKGRGSALEGEGETVMVPGGPGIGTSRALLDRDVGVAAMELGLEPRDAPSNAGTTTVMRLC